VIGAGRVGTALAVLLSRAGHRIVAVSGRHGTEDRAARYLPGVPVLQPAQAAALANCVLLSVPDDLVRPHCSEISTKLHRGVGVGHVSGSLGLDVLAPAAHWGAVVFSLHPLQTVPDVEGGVSRIPGSAFAVTAANETGYAIGERLAREAGGEPFRIRNEAKPLYHAAAVFASNYLTTVEAVAEKLFRIAGLQDPRSAMSPLAAATLMNALRRGPGDALTGPAVRGDVRTIERNLTALRQLAPETIPAYIALARLALDLAEDAGRLDGHARRRVEDLLSQKKWEVQQRRWR